MEKIDILFVHLGKGRNDKENILTMPIGLLALANYLDKRAVNVRVLNLPLMERENNKFNLYSFIEDRKVRIVGISLHWHCQSYGTISLAKRIKDKNKNITVILGGFTATFFHYEIMKRYKFIDYIVRGDTEVPVYKLVTQILSYRDSFYNVPNLTWRNRDEIVVNRQRYTISKAIFDELFFFDLRLLINNNESYYLNSSLKNYREYNCFKEKKISYYNIGRGCSVNCSYCGGAKKAQRLINNRDIIIKSQSSVFRDLEMADSLGIDYIHTCFDPYPGSHVYKNLFKSLEKRDFKFSFIFESWGLPSREFISLFSNLFNKPMLVLSPDTGSERIRRLNKGFYYSNKDLIKILEICNKDDNIEVKVNFTNGLPFENDEDLYKTILFIKFIKKNFNVILASDIIELEPASPIYLNPKKYRVRLNRFTFDDFLKASASHFRSAGYSTYFFSEEQIIYNNKFLQKLCDKE